MTTYVAYADDVALVFLYKPNINNYLEIVSFFTLILCTKNNLKKKGLHQYDLYLYY